MSIILLVSFALFSFVRGNCPYKLDFTVGSYTAQPWLESANGTGLSFVTFNTRGVSVTTTFHPALVGANPAYAARARQYLYVANDLASGKITQIQFNNRLPYVTALSKSTGEHASSASPVHVTVDKRTENTVRLVVVTANFGGSVSSFIKTATSLFKSDQFTIPKTVGSWRDQSKLNQVQDGPHAHMALPYGAGVLVTDYGSDMVFYLSLNKTTGKFGEINRIKFFAGEGPRHAVGHPLNKNVYVVTEFSLKIATLKPGCGGSDDLGVCERRNILAVTNPAARASAIRISANGKFLYVAVRYPNLTGKIVGFRLNPEGDIVGKIGEFPSGGLHPNDFVIVERARIGDGCKSFIAVVNRDSHNIIILKRIFTNGKLVPTRYRTKIPTPVSITI